MNRPLNLYNVLLALIVVLTIGSCKKEATDPGGTAVRAVAGEWWVQMDATGAYSGISTYNTSANIPTEMWFDDHFYGTKSKISVDQSNLTFSANKVKNSDPDYEVDITIKNAKIILNGAKGPVSKAVTDSIYYEAEYSDDPGTIYKLSGYRRTRFAGDDH